MPELPEVETVRRTLATALRGRRILALGALNWPRTLETPTPEQLRERLVDRAIGDVDRRAKYLLIRLDNDETLVVHLRMTGRLLVVPASTPLDTHTRLVITLDNATELRFVDARKFGRVGLLGRDQLAQLDARLGPEPLAEEFSIAQLAGLLSGRRARIKPLLLDQQVLAGLGNIYVDEALWRARIHPLRSADTLTGEEIALLHRSIVDVLSEAVERRGTTLLDYRDAWGEKGENQNFLNAYDRTGQPCVRCGSPIEKMIVGQRGTHFCPTCQERHR